MSIVCKWFWKYFLVFFLLWKYFHKVYFLNSLLVFHFLKPTSWYIQFDLYSWLNWIYIFFLPDLVSIRTVFDRIEIVNVYFDHLLEALTSWNRILPLLNIQNRDQLYGSLNSYLLPGSMRILCKWNAYSYFTERIYFYALLYRYWCS